LLSDGTYNYAYDPNGNRTSRTTIATGEKQVYTWDYRNRLTDLVTETSTGTVESDTHYAYDSSDRRIGKEVTTYGATPSDTIERYTYDGAGMVLVMDGTGAVTHRILEGPNPDEELADEDASKSSSDPTAVTWLLGDNQQSVKDVVYSDGSEADHISYDSFGNIIGQSAPSAQPRFGYTGMQTDTESGLLYDNARYYDPITGNFVSMDPKGFAAGDANLYRYVGNDSVNAVDPTGFATVTTPMQSQDLSDGWGQAASGPGSTPFGTFNPDGTLNFDSNSGASVGGVGTNSAGQGASGPAGGTTPDGSGGALDSGEDSTDGTPGNGDSDPRQANLKSMRDWINGKTTPPSATAVGGPYDDMGLRIWRSNTHGEGWRIDENGNYEYWSRGGWTIPCVVCHGSNGDGMLPGLTPTDSYVDGTWYHSGSNANIIQNYMAGAVGQLTKMVLDTGQAAAQSSPLIAMSGASINTPNIRSDIEDFLAPNRNAGNTTLTSAGEWGGVALFQYAAFEATLALSAAAPAATGAASGVEPYELAAEGVYTPGPTNLGPATIGTAGVEPYELGAESQTTVQQLQGAANRAAANVGSGSGSVYGTYVHSAFSDEIEALNNPNLFSEQSYLNGEAVDYGTSGSVRIDVGEGTVENPTAAYDLKTGSAKLTPARIRQIQSHLPGGSSVPVYQMRPQ
jgi:RHS repeat-associated protein